jgi:hypothetical protein
MNRLLYPSLFCFMGLLACGSRHKHPVRPTVQSGHETESVDSAVAKGDVHGRDIIASGVGPDSSLLSLKATAFAALSDVLSQDWKFDDADKSHWNEIFWDSVKDKRQFPELALFRDHTVTENARCRLRMGKWAINKDTRELILRFGHGATRTYFVRDIAMKQMALTWRRPSDAVELTLSAEALVHKRPEEDPFYPGNNQWRIRPSVAETDEQLRARVRECVHFYALFFRDIYQRGETEISYSGLPNCFIWYNGGIGMQAKEDLGDKWMNCFYSSYQALKAYEMVASILGRHQLKWAEHPASWVKEIADVLDQIAEKL